VGELHAGAAPDTTGEAGAPGRDAPDAQLAKDVVALRSMIDEGRLVDGRGLLGVEVEFQLVDAVGAPAHRNAAVLAALEGDPHDLQPELAQFNIELNLPPVPLDDAPLTTIRARIDAAVASIAAVDPQMTALAIGTLPTLSARDLDLAAISERPRYHALNASIMGARGGAFDVHIDGQDGEDALRLHCTTILLEAAATSLQIHLDLPAAGLVAAWNTAQAIAAIQVALGANAPLLLGHALWHETRIPLFEQVIDVRGSAAAHLGTPPRVWFGARWIDHPAELFEENVAHFGPLLAHTPAPDDTTLAALVLHNGTVWRWNRPVFSLVDGHPNLRLENRVLAAPPTTVDATADIALFLGLVAGLREGADRLTTSLPFGVAEQNFRRAARDGIGASIEWPGSHGLRAVPVARLVRDELLEVAATGLDALGVPESEASSALDVIAGRVTNLRNGATWQLAAFAHERTTTDPHDASRRVVQRYRELQAIGEPVHHWPIPGAE
jgi:gamma-glutamyl:cysteine ligase YbdK (ATP-grasp superfamily)